MERETIIYRGDKYHRYPKSKHLHLRRYFWAHTSKTPHALHRQIWIDNVGPIPPKHHIHHRDGDTSNNSISNLECISASEHARHHMLQPERVQKSRQNIKHAQKFATAWHKSPAGRKWHREHAIEIAHGKAKQVTCHECRKEFTTTVKRHSRFCSKRCRSRHDARTFRKANPHYYRQKNGVQLKCRGLS